MRFWSHCLSISLALFASTALTAAPPTAVPPNAVQQAMYFRSQAADASNCKPTIRKGRVDWGAIGNPASQCPDAYAWVSFAQAIEGQFWTWATDQTLWPAKPKALCGPGQSGPDCCDPAKVLPDKPVQGAPDPACPYYPPDWSQAPELSTTTARLVSSHNFGFLRKLDPARILREEEAEIVFRNKSFVRYTLNHNLYTKEGLGARFTALSNWIGANAPYRNEALLVSYPGDAVMFKADFISEKLMRENKLIQDIPGSAIPNNPKHPYITIVVDAEVGKSTQFKPGRYYLLAITAASKALPGWHWYAIEHVANPGRCDYNGCNDSFGYLAERTTPAGQRVRQNFIPPHTQVAFEAVSGSGEAPEVVFLLGKKYPPETTGEAITPPLADMLKALGIGTGSVARKGDLPTVQDGAWMSYRLKGSQTEFVGVDGMEYNLGASITEGGFVSSASCMTCHSQAGPNATGNPGLGAVGSQPRLSDFGYNLTVYGPPDLGWFYSFGSTQLLSQQTDFVWGMLNAQCVNPQLVNGQPTGNCLSYQVAAPKAVVDNFSSP